MMHESYDENEMKVLSEKSCMQFGHKEFLSPSKNKHPPLRVGRSFLVPGYQSVIRDLEKKELCCAVFSSDVTPALLLKVALAQAQANNVPVLVIPHLRTITRSTLGFAAMALGFKNIVAECMENIFNPIYRTINENPTVVEQLSVFKSVDEEIPMDIVDYSITNTPKPNQTKTKYLYHYRKPNGPRAFCPSNTIENKQVLTLKKENSSNDFISVGCSSQSRPNYLKTVKKDFHEEPIINDDDDDDSDSEMEEESVFFVDNRPDASLLNANTVEKLPNKSAVMQHKLKKKNKKLKNIPFHKQLKDKSNKKQFHKNDKRSKMFECNPNLVNFRPLSIKTVTNNLKKVKTKNKKIKHV